MEGNFGVFDGLELLAEFGNDDDADEHRRSLLQEGLPEHLRTPLYDSCDLEVRRVPEDYDLWYRTLRALRASRSWDLRMEMVRELADAAS